MDKFELVPWQCWHMLRVKMAIESGSKALPATVAAENMATGEVAILYPYYDN